MAHREQQLSTSDLTARAEGTEGSPEDEAARDARASDDEVRGSETTATEAHEPLFPSDESADLRRRWEGIQTAFVDEPQQSVQQADALVAEVLRRVAESFSGEREGLESQWGRGEDVSTENLRQILQRYRSFFNRLLSA